MNEQAGGRWKPSIRRVSAGLLLAVLGCVGGVAARGQSAAAADNGVYVPSTVSKPWQDFWGHYAAWPSNPLPGPDDLAAWDQVSRTINEGIAQYGNPNLVSDMHLTVKERVVRGVPVLEVLPQKLDDPHRVVLYMHGGAYTFESAKLTLLAAGQMANAAGMRVISVDYTVAPHGKWPTVLNQVVAVYQSLLDEGYKASAIGFFGESAGGGLAAGSILKIRDEHLPLPGALVLWSPWADITFTGDTYVTLAQAEPLLKRDSLVASAAAYAAPADQKNPYVSPVYGDFSKGFPPTLIQVGTKEIFLSNCVRLYQAIDMAGIPVKLDVYEGMPHVFQVLLASSDEATTAVRKSGEFMKRYLATDIRRKALATQLPTTR